MQTVDRASHDTPRNDTMIREAERSGQALTPERSRKMPILNTLSSPARNGTLPPEGNPQAMQGLAQPQSLTHCEAQAIALRDVAPAAYLYGLVGHVLNSETD